jgi:hypothetical protein
LFELIVFFVSVSTIPDPQESETDGIPVARRPPD